MEMFHAVQLPHILTLSALLFVIGMLGIFVNRKNILVILMCLELVLLSVNINFVAFSVYHNDIGGQVFTFFILTVAAAEVAIGLAILTQFFRLRGSADIDDVGGLRG